MNDLLGSLEVDMLEIEDQVQELTYLYDTHILIVEDLDDKISILQGRNLLI